MEDFMVLGNSRARRDTKPGFESNPAAGPLSILNPGGNPQPGGGACAGSKRGRVTGIARRPRQAHGQKRREKAENCARSKVFSPAGEIGGARMKARRTGQLPSNCWLLRLFLANRAIFLTFPWGTIQHGKYGIRWRKRRQADRARRFVVEGAHGRQSQVWRASV